MPRPFGGGVPSTKALPIVRAFKRLDFKTYVSPVNDSVSLTGVAATGRIGGTRTPTVATNTSAASLFSASDTVAGVPIGSAFAGRVVALFIASNDVSSVTIGGVPAIVTNFNSAIFVAAAVVPTGTTATVVAGPSATSTEILGVWSITGNPELTPTFTSAVLAFDLGNAVSVEAGSSTLGLLYCTALADTPSFTAGISNNGAAYLDHFGEVLILNGSADNATTGTVDVFATGFTESFTILFAVVYSGELILDATGSSGSVNVDANPNGVSSTTAVGTLTASITADANLTTVFATGQVGTPTVTGAANVTLTGVSSTSTVNTVTVTGAANVSITGVTGTGQVGTPTAGLGGQAFVTGVSATGQVGTLSAVITATVTLSGVSAIGSTGTISVTGTANVPVTGVSATGAVNTVTVTGTANVPITGVVATGQVNTVTVSAKANVTLTGVSATGQVGTVAITGTANVPLTGVSTTGVVGTLTASITDNSTVVLSSVTAVGQVGILTVIEPPPPASGTTFANPFIVTLGRLKTLG